VGAPAHRVRDSRSSRRIRGSWCHPRTLLPAAARRESRDEGIRSAPLACFLACLDLVAADSMSLFVSTADISLRLVFECLFGSCRSAAAAVVETRGGFWFLGALCLCRRLFPTPGRQAGGQAYHCCYIQYALSAPWENGASTRRGEQSSTSDQGNK
jgi:hypothetical protein